MTTVSAERAELEMDGRLDCIRKIRRGHAAQRTRTNEKGQVEATRPDSGGARDPGRGGTPEVSTGPAHLFTWARNTKSWYNLTQLYIFDK